MPKKSGITVVTLGVVLIVSALLLFIYNRYESDMAGQVAESLMSDLESRMEELQTEPVTESTEPSEPALDSDMPVVSINGYSFVGYVEIPVLELKLPVMSEWDYNLLQISPCRQHGSYETDDLVIAAHNYRTQFGRLNKLSVGDYVIFTDVEGVINNYSVAKVTTVDPNDVDAVLNSEFDLVLYTCTLSGKTRVAVFCSRSEDDITE